MKLHGMLVNGMPGVEDSSIIFGQLTSIFGANGAGKSRLLKEISKLLFKNNEDHESPIDNNWTGVSKHTLFLKFENIFQQGYSVDDFVINTLLNDVRQSLPSERNKLIETQNELTKLPELDRMFESMSGVGEDSNTSFQSTDSVINFLRQSFIENSNLQGLTLETIFQKYWMPLPKEQERRIYEELLKDMHLSLSTGPGVVNPWTVYGRIHLEKLQELVGEALISVLIPQMEIQIAAGTQSINELFTLSQDHYEQFSGLKITDKFSYPYLPAFYFENNTIMIPILSTKYDSLFEERQSVNDVSVYGPVYGPPKINFDRLSLRRFFPETIIPGKFKGDVTQAIVHSIGLIATHLKRRSSGNFWSLGSWGESSQFNWLQGNNDSVKSPEDSASSIDPYILLARDLLQKNVNKFLPEFISDSNSFIIEIMNPKFWQEKGRVVAGLTRKPTYEEELDRLVSEQNAEKGLQNNSVQHTWRLSSTSKSGSFIPISESGSGIERWVTTTLAICTNEMLRADPEVNGMGIDLQEFVEEIYDLHEDGKPSDNEVYNQLTSVELNIDLSNTVVLIDEPEAFLHPGAISSIGKWIQDMAIQSAGFIVVTHNSKIFDIELINSKRIVMIKEKGTSKIRELNTDVSAMGQWAEDIGITTGELFLLTKRWLIVEGEVDKIILTTWYKKLFAERGIRCVSASGSGNITYLMQVDFLAGIGSNVTVLLDKAAPGAQEIDLSILQRNIANHMKEDLVKPDQLIDSKLSTGEIRFIAQAHQHEDIWFYLEPEIIKKVAQNNLRNFSPKGQWDFTSWDEAWNIHFQNWLDGKPGYIARRDATKKLKKTVKQFKEFMREEQDIVFSAGLTKEIAEIQMLEEKIPVSLTKLIEIITSPYAGQVLKRQ